jgi:RNA polymerase sigma factor (sigma-70 family)
VPLNDAIEFAPAPAMIVDAALEREFEARVTDSSSLAFRVALAVLRRREDAEDVAQETFLRVRRAFSSLRDRDRLRAWIVRTAFRLALDQQRGRARRQRREDVAAANHGPAPSLEDDLVRGQIREKVGGAVDALPESCGS